MSNAVPVFDALPSLGFISRGFGLTFVHRQCELVACESANPVAPCVSFTGNSNHAGRSSRYIEFNLPPAVESLEQLKAFLAYYLGDAFTSDVPAWIAEGRLLSHHLPWERDRAAYAARDHCTVRREWMKLALRELAEGVKSLQPDDPIRFTFDGASLCIDYGKRILVQAEGTAWGQAYTLKAGQLVPLPRRLMRAEIEVSLWKSYLTIANRRYPLAAVADATQTA